LDTSVICQLSAEVFFLLNIFFGEGGCEVFGLEDLADLHVAVACGVGVGTALDPLDGLFERLDLPEPEAGDEFLGQALSVGLSNAYFKSLGLPTLIDGC
jgi:hypothetical protein